MISNFAGCSFFYQLSVNFNLILINTKNFINHPDLLNKP